MLQFGKGRASKFAQLLNSTISRYHKNLHGHRSFSWGVIYNLYWQPLLTTALNILNRRYGWQKTASVVDIYKYWLQGDHQPHRFHSRFYLISAKISIASWTVRTELITWYESSYEVFVLRFCFCFMKMVFKTVNRLSRLATFYFLETRCDMIYGFIFRKHKNTR
jgi:hypothetical protein